MAEKTMMEMREDERLLLQLDTNIEYAFYMLVDGFGYSKIYESIEGKELLGKLIDKLSEAGGLVQKLQKIASIED